MEEGILDIIYYTNPMGAVSVSYDEGETIVLPTGRRIPLNRIWEESEEDMEPKLSPPQQAELALFRARPPMTEIEQIAWDLRKQRLANARFYAEPEVARIVIPESAQVVMSEIEKDE